MLRAAAILALVVAAAAAPAAAQDLERVRLTDAGPAPSQPLPKGVFVTLASPADYTRGSTSEDAGTWVGPAFGPATRARASIAWSLRLTQATDSMGALAVAPGRGWEVDLKARIAVPHTIGGRTVGTMIGAYSLTRNPAPNSAAYELSLAFPVAVRLFALVRFDLLDPGDARSTVDGLPADLWNRGQALRAMVGVALDGSLPPTRTSASVTRGGRSVRGLVADAFRHPVVGATVVLERFASSGWRRVRTVRADARGAFRFARLAPHRRYRAVAELDGVTARSPSVRTR